MPQTCAATSAEEAPASKISTALSRNVFGILSIEITLANAIFLESVYIFLTTRYKTRLSAWDINTLNTTRPHPPSDTLLPFLMHSACNKTQYHNMTVILLTENKLCIVYIAKLCYSYSQSSRQNTLSLFNVA